MAIQIGEKKKKKPVLFILLIIVVIGFIIFKVIKKNPVVNVKNINSELAVGNVKSVESAMQDISKILEDSVFQQLVSHNTVNLQPTNVGKEDPFAN